MFRERAWPPVGWPGHSPGRCAGKKVFAHISQCSFGPPAPPAATQAAQPLPIGVVSQASPKPCSRRWIGWAWPNQDKLQCGPSFLQVKTASISSLRFLSQLNLKRLQIKIAITTLLFNQKWYSSESNEQPAENANRIHIYTYIAQCQYWYAFRGFLLALPSMRALCKTRTFSVGCHDLFEFHIQAVLWPTVLMDTYVLQSACLLLAWTVKAVLCEAFLEIL